MYRCNARHVAVLISFNYSQTSGKQPPKISSLSGCLQEVGAYESLDYSILGQNVAWIGYGTPNFRDLPHVLNTLFRVWFSKTSRFIYPPGPTLNIISSIHFKFLEQIKHYCCCCEKAISRKILYLPLRNFCILCDN